MLLTAQESKKFKKRVLESAEIDILSSYYTQSGNNAAVTGGIGNEDLQDVATNINVSIPVNADDVLTIDATVSAYTSASSSNLNPFTGASSGEGDDDDDDDDRPSYTKRAATQPITGSPWVASSGASKSDVWLNATLGYSHTSDSRNTIIASHLSVSNEFDYFSLGGGLNWTQLFNKKNTEFGLGVNVYLDHWRPVYPTEIKTYIANGGNLNADFFQGVNIYNHSGFVIDKNSANAWKPQTDNFISNKARNTYTASISFSQILSKNMQISIFSDLTYQSGQLANPMQRVYFKDKPNFYIGNPADIRQYTSPSNTQVFQLADAYEQLPETRLKIPVGVRLHYFITDFLVLRTYYRYYFDDWDLFSHTVNIEMPIKLSDKFTLIPDYRYYTQTQAKYFAPYNQHLSSQTFYTSDYDLSAYSSNQFGIGLRYSDALMDMKLWKLGIKNINLNYHFYDRTTGLKAQIVSLGMSLSLE